MNKKFKSKRAVKREIFNMLYVLLGAVSMAVAVGMFLKPFNLVTGNFRFIYRSLQYNQGVLHDPDCRPRLHNGNLYGYYNVGVVFYRLDFSWQKICAQNGRFVDKLYRAFTCCHNSYGVGLVFWRNV